MNPLIGPAPIKRRWFGDDARRRIHYGGTGSAGDIAAALLSIPGVTSVGLADPTDDRRVEMFMVDILIRYAPLSMTDDDADRERELLQSTVEQSLYNHLAAGIGHRVTFEFV